MRHYNQQRNEVAPVATDAERGPLRGIPGNGETADEPSLAMALQSGPDGEGQQGQKA